MNLRLNLKTVTTKYDCRIFGLQVVLVGELAKLFNTLNCVVLISSPCADQLWCPPNLLSNGYVGLLPWG